MLLLSLLFATSTYVSSLGVAAAPTCDAATRLNYAQQFVKAAFTANPIESAAIIDAVPVASNATFRQVYDGVVGPVTVAVDDVSYRLKVVAPGPLLELRSTPTYQSNPNGTITAFYLAGIRGVPILSGSCFFIFQYTTSCQVFDTLDYLFLPAGTSS